MENDMSGQNRDCCLWCCGLAACGAACSTPPPHNGLCAFSVLKENDFLCVGRGKKEEHKANYTAPFPFKGLLLTLHPIPDIVVHL